MADAHAKQHDYHLVDPSPWPAIGSVAAFIAAVGAISWMHQMFAAAPIVFGIGMAGILYTMLGWWMEVMTILLRARLRMISRTCSLSLDDKPEVGSSKR